MMIMGGIWVYNLLQVPWNINLDLFPLSQQQNISANVVYGSCSGHHNKSQAISDFKSLTIALEISKQVGKSQSGKLTYVYFLLLSWIT